MLIDDGRFVQCIFKRPYTRWTLFLIDGNRGTDRGIGTLKHAKAILNYFILGSILKLKLHHCKH